MSNKAIHTDLHNYELLHSLGQILAMARDRDALFNAIFEKVEPVIGFDRSANIFIIEPDGKHYSFFFKMSDYGDGESIVEPHLRLKFPVTDLVFRDIIDAGGPLIMDLEETLKKYPQQWGFNVMRDLGLQQAMTIPLRVGQKLIGCLTVHSYEKNRFSESQFNIFQGIANYIAIAVANILANEDILNRQREKETLLKISEAITTVRNLPQLFQIIMEKLRPILHFEDATAIHVKEDLMKFRTSGTVSLDTYEIHELFSGLVNKWIDVNGSEVEWSMEQKTIFRMETKNLESLFPQSPLIKGLAKENLEHSIGLRLKSPTGLLGFFYLHFDHRPKISYDLLRGIAEQLSLSVTNILANETLEYKNGVSTFQMAVADRFNSSEAWPKKYLELSKAFQAWVPFDLIGYSLKDGQEYKTFFFERIGAVDYRDMSALSFAKMCHLTVPEVNRAIHAYEDQVPFFANRRDFKALAINDIFIGTVQKYFKIRACLRTTMSSSQGHGHQLVFFSKTPNTYSEEHLAFINTIAYSLTLVLGKHLSQSKIMALTERLQQEKEYLQEEINITYNFKEIVGTSTALKEVLLKVQQVAQSDTTVLITGETGTGKELFARALHDYSKRNNKAMVKVNCATLPPQLMESELFGHEKGSFTGADRQRQGKFEFANGSTIFLDEIGEMPFDMQAKLLRVLQEKEFERLGGNRTMKTDVRIVAATNRNLSLEVEKGNFRADLFYRLNVFPIHIPPLRERMEDITPLALHFLKKSIRKLGTDITGISSASLKELLKSPWLGNVRELEHIIERSVIVNQGSILQVKMDKLQMSPMEGKTGVKASPFGFKKLKDVEREAIVNTLHFCNGRIRGIGGAAELLDINPQTLESRMKRLGIVKEHVVKTN